MNFHQLILQRDALLRQARLANAAYAHERLGEFAARIARARLRGAVSLEPGDPAGEQPWPGLTALEGSQAVLAEHFLDEEVPRSLWAEELDDFVEHLAQSAW